MEEENKEIFDFVKEYFKLYFIERNYDKTMELLSSEMTVIGTGLQEYAKTPEETLLLYRKDFNEVKSPIKYSDLNIIVNVNTPNFSLVSGDFSITGETDGLQFLIPQLRYSMTIRKENDLWKIIHLHISTPNDQQEEEELYPLQKLIKQNELLNQKVEERTKELIDVNNNLLKSNQTKDKLFSIISHDIRSPFNSLLGFIDVLLDQYDELDPDKHKEYLNIIRESSNKIFNLVDNLLLWSKLQQSGIELNPTPLNLRDIVQKCSSVCKETLLSKNICFKNSVDSSIIVLSDEFMLSTILRNLISNSIKYTQPNGSITIRIEHNRSEHEDEITVCVEDTGIGIPQNQINKLFSSEFNQSIDGTNHEKGTGIGLSICKEFIKLHQTKIWVESKLNNGSKFYFNLKSI